MRVRTVLAAALVAAAFAPTVPAQAAEERIPPPCAEYDLTNWTELLYCVSQLTRNVAQIEIDRP